MPNIKELDPGASPLHYFGAELRRLREKAGLTLAQLGSIVYLTGSMIGQIETATKTPKEEHVSRFDLAVGADGALIRLWELVKRHRLPGWYQQIAEMERSAREIRVFHTQLVHGLLQTAGYARAVLSVMRQGDLEGKVEARLDRQQVLARSRPPLLWVVLSEAVIHQEVGGKAVMREQLAHLLDCQLTDEVQVQVLPFSAGAHTGLSGSFTLFSFEDQADAAYSEDYEGGNVSINPQEVRARSLRYDLLRANALPPGESAELIARVMEDRYEHRSECGPHPVAQVQL